MSTFPSYSVNCKPYVLNRLDGMMTLRPVYIPMILHHAVQPLYTHLVKVHLSVSSRY